jgi:hypothetical protein
MSTPPHTPDKPDILQQHNSPEIRLLDQKIWEQCNIENQHFMAAIVGREGSGKSYTALRIAELVDPSFNAERVMFEPQAFLEKLQEWKANGETQGKMVVADEAGVGLGVRTWYQKDQVLFNQVLQVIRDENMGIIFTLPRLNELDSQARGRLHAFIEMTDLDAGNWAQFKWLRWLPSRDERDATYRKYPHLNINGRQRKVKRCKLGPPSQPLIEAYSDRKDAFQDELYQDAIDEMDEDKEDEQNTVSDVTEQIKSDEEVGNCLSWHGAHKKWYVSKDMIRSEYSLSHSDAQAVKQNLQSDSEIDIQAIGKRENKQGE